MKRILLLARAGTVVTFLVMSVSSFAADCGGDGQRACCNWGFEFSNNGTACDSGMAYSNGCTAASCACGPIPSESSTGMCYKPTTCGGAGQRACCDFDGEFSNNGLACNSGLVQIPDGCNSANPALCICPAGLEYSSGICVQPAPCGDKGQRSCCTATLEYASNSQDAGFCNDKLTLVPGCSGDCTCGGTTSLGEPDTYSCTDMATIWEPTTNATPTPDESGQQGWTLPSTSTLLAGPECPSTGVCGYADLHVHMWANLAHGGAFVAGAPWDPNGGA
jgi:hypothetical protein